MIIQTLEHPAMKKGPAETHESCRLLDFLELFVRLADRVLLPYALFFCWNALNPALAQLHQRIIDAAKKHCHSVLFKTNLSKPNA